MYFSRKIVISGNIVEYYKYSRTQKKQFHLIDPPLKKRRQQGESRQDSLYRTRQKIRRLVGSNFNAGDKFVTLTYAYPMRDLKLSNRIFSKFIMRMKLRFPDLKYFAVPELQSDIDYSGKIKPSGGSLHYHMIMQIPYFDVLELKKIWGQGGVDIKNIKNCDNVGAYISAYMSKENASFFFSGKKYFCSKNLQQPQEIADDRIVQSYMQFCNFTEKNVHYKATFDNEYTGRVLYMQYRLDGTPC